MKNGYLVKIVPPVGYKVYRFEFTRRHVMVALGALLLVLGSVSGFYLWDMRYAEARVHELRSVTLDQRERLTRIDAAAAQLDSELRSLDLQNRQLRKIIGVGGDVKSVAPARKAPAVDRRHSMRADAFLQVATRIQNLRADSLRIRSEGDRLRRLTLHVLNMRRLEEISRDRLLAAIPSINPAGTASIVSSFGWRVIPWPEFHKGVDLDANYGDTVRAAAAGTVVSAGYDGGYGIKVDIDHANGYHTWYCHLSRADVHPGQYVTKAQAIALVGSTGASTGPHLHYQMMQDGNPIDPQPFLTGVPAKVLANLK